MLNSEILNGENMLEAEFDAIFPYTYRDYEQMLNKPSINGVILEGDKTTEELNIEIPDVSKFITKDVNNLTNYELKTNTGNNITLFVDPTTYVMTINLKNSEGTVISTQSTDLPLETMVVNATYDNTTKEIVLTLQNGNILRVSVADLVSGLAKSSEVYTKEEIDTKLETKANTSDIPTNLSSLENDAGFIDKTVNNLDNYYNKESSYSNTEINELLGQVTIEGIQSLDMGGKTFNVSTHDFGIYRLKNCTGISYENNPSYGFSSFDESEINTVIIFGKENIRCWAIFQIKDNDAMIYVARRDTKYDVQETNATKFFRLSTADMPVVSSKLNSYYNKTQTDQKISEAITSAIGTALEASY